MRPLWFLHLYIPSSATTALSTLCQGRLCPHIYFFIYIFLYLNILIYIYFLFTHFYTFFICPAESCRFQITSIRGTGYVTFWYQGFLRMENTSRWIVPVLTLEMATLFSLGCLVLGRYESKKVFWRNCINVDQKKSCLCRLCRRDRFNGQL